MLSSDNKNVIVTTKQLTEKFLQAQLQHLEGSDGTAHRNVGSGCTVQEVMLQALKQRRSFPERTAASATLRRIHLPERFPLPFTEASVTPCLPSFLAYFSTCCNLFTRYSAWYKTIPALYEGLLGSWENGTSVPRHDIY
jgi:hypothetical protein